MLRNFSNDLFARLPALSLPPDVALELPQGQRLGSPNPLVKLAFSDWSSIGRIKAGQIGALAEEYVEGKLQLQGAMRDVMRVAIRLMDGSLLQGTPDGWSRWPRVWRKIRSLAAHTPARDAAQIEFHYDVSDDFYALWLDPRRVYSCAYYPDLADANVSLAAAQEAKLDLICRKLMLRPGDRFLDIGCGWGGLLLWAAEHYGADCTGITLSKNQHAHALRLIEAKGLKGRVHVELRDYRDLPESKPFDKIASVGMFEHVGRENMTTYFDKIARLLQPGGLVLNHGITAGGLENRQLGAGMGDFIEKYIFPGGELVHASDVLRHMARAGLEMVDTENLRPHYARTLWDWSDRLEARLASAREVLGHGRGGAAQAERTLRAYRLYLAGSAMSFDEGWISLHQFLATRIEGQPVGFADVKARAKRTVYPFNRKYMYRNTESG
jgi:cyclopropane-fatty-acyl-phospholipid synthase